jgi:hypothetical protein
MLLGSPSTSAPTFTTLLSHARVWSFKKSSAPAAKLKTGNFQTAEVAEKPREVRKTECGLACDARATHNTHNTHTN